MGFRRGLPNGTAGHRHKRAVTRFGRMTWLVLALAAGLSVIPLVFLVAEAGGNGVPEVNPLFIGALALIWLALEWGLVALYALVPRGYVRIPVLVLLLVQYPFTIVPMAVRGVQGLASLYDDPSTGRGYFDSQVDRDLAGAIWACDPANRVDHGAVCDLDKVAALARSTDTAKVGRGGESHMALALYDGANRDVVRIVLRGGKPPHDISDLALSLAFGSQDIDLLRAVLEGGVDPNTRGQVGDPYSIEAIGWDEGRTALLDAGASIDLTDHEGYTMLMRAISWRRYDVAAMCLARGAATDRVAADGATAASLLAAIPPGDAAHLPPAVRALADGRRPP